VALLVAALVGGGVAVEVAVGAAVLVGVAVAVGVAVDLAVALLALLEESVEVLAEAEALAEALAVGSLAIDSVALALVPGAVDWVGVGSVSSASVPADPAALNPPPSEEPSLALARPSE
jgi:hypothetical protein